MTIVNGCLKLTSMDVGVVVVGGGGGGGGVSTIGGGGGGGARICDGGGGGGGGAPICGGDGPSFCIGSLWLSFKCRFNEYILEKPSLQISQKKLFPMLTV